MQRTDFLVSMALEGLRGQIQLENRRRKLLELNSGDLNLSFRTTRKVSEVILLAIEELLLSCLTKANSGEKISFEVLLELSLIFSHSSRFRIQGTGRQLHIALSEGIFS
jgi:hypothetical protein